MYHGYVSVVDAFPGLYSRVLSITLKASLIVKTVDSCHHAYH